MEGCTFTAGWAKRDNTNMSGNASVFEQCKRKRQAEKTYDVTFKRKKQKVTISSDYAPWKTDDILLRALTRQQQTPPFTKTIGQGSAWPGKAKAVSLIKEYDKAYKSAEKAGAALTLTGSRSALVTGGSTVPDMSRHRADLVFEPLRLAHESDDESCSSDATFVRHSGNVYL